jgi:predicted nucleic acid-binding Zn ribbon protein
VIDATLRCAYACGEFFLNRKKRREKNVITICAGAFELIARAYFFVFFRVQNNENG